MIKFKDSILAHLIISASPGGYKIFLLAAVGYLGSSTTQGEIANELAIISFLSLLTSIGTGILLIHIVPKSPCEAAHANAIFKGILIKSIPHILLVCLTLVVINHTAVKINSIPSLAAALLFTTSIYWLLRHLQIARKNTDQAIRTEASIWILTITGLTISSNYYETTTESTIIVVVFSYLIAIAGPIIKILQAKTDFNTRFYKESILISFSNLSSGGLMFLAPSIAFHFGSAATAGLVGIMTNSLAISLAGIRAYLNKVIPNISNLISQKKHDSSKNLSTISQKKVNKFLALSGIAALPFLYLISSHTQPTTSTTEIAILSILVTAFCLTPQLSAIDSIIANYYSKSGQVLVINTLHAAAVIITTIAYELTNPATNKTTEIFLLSSTALYIVRNIAIKKCVKQSIPKNHS